MAYSRNPTWQNSPSVATPITAAALEAIEAGLVNAAGVADSSITALAGKEPAISRTGATTGQVATLQAGGGLAFATPAAGGGIVAAATTTTQGIVQLAGDLAGTAAAPTVPALAGKLSSTDPSVTNARTPTSHATTHATGGTDPITLTSIGAQVAGSYAPATGIAPTAVTGTAVVTADTRLADARTPLAHKASHATGGADLLLPADIGAATVASVAANTTAIAAANGRALAYSIALGG